MLTNDDIENAKPREKDYKIYDAKGLYVLITKSGGKLFRLKYRFNKVEKTLVIGSAEVVSLEEARQRVIQARNYISKGIDPSIAKKEAKNMNLYSPIKILRSQLKHLEEMQESLKSKKREIEDQLDSVNYDLNEVVLFVEETKTAIKFLEGGK